MVYPLPQKRDADHQNSYRSSLRAMPFRRFTSLCGQVSLKPLPLRFGSLWLIRFNDAASHSRILVVTLFDLSVEG